MKVALISPYSDALVGGIINWTKYVVNYHQKHSQDVELRLIYNRHPKGLYGTGSMIQSVKVGLANYLPVCKEFRKAAKEENFDVVHVSTSASFGLFRDLMIWRTAKKHGIKMCLHMHFGRIPLILKSKGWEACLFRFLLKRIDRAVVMDMASYNALKMHGYNNVCYLPNPLGEDIRKMIECCSDVIRDENKVFFAGHITATKGVYELVEACSEIRNVKLDLYGKVLDEETSSDLYKIGGEESVKWLNIPGNKAMEDVVQAMKRCSVFALPSYSEGFPNVIIEAMACGCPIVATGVGAIPEMLNIGSDEPCGVCVEPRNEKELKVALYNMLENAERAKEFGEKAKKRVYEYYSMPKVWSQLTGIWKSLCD